VLPKGVLMRATHKTTGDTLEVITTIEEHRQLVYDLEKIYNHKIDEITETLIIDTWNKSLKMIETEGKYQATVLKNNKINGIKSVKMDDLLFEHL